MSEIEDRKRAERLVGSLADFDDPVEVANAFIGLYRADLLQQVRETVEAVPTGSYIEYSDHKEWLEHTADAIRRDILAAINKLGAPAKGE